MNEKPQLVFIHCADLHLDSPFEGLHQIDSHIASVLRDATFQAFEKVIDFTIAENCDFLLISGDVYNEADRSLRAKLRFRDQLQRAMEAGIPCFVAHGNHDPLSGWEAEISLPDGVTRFGGEKVELIPFREGKDDRAHIYGISFPVREVRENLAKRFRRESNSVFSIAVLHCNLGGNTEYDNYAPCVLDDLMASQFDYWALGHIHTRCVVREQNPVIIYPGNIQGRNITETGPRGCYLIKVWDLDTITVNFLETDVVRWFEETIDISPLKTLDDLWDEMTLHRENVRARAAGKASILRLHLMGRGDLHRELHSPKGRDTDWSAILREGEPDRSDFVWVESVDGKTRPCLDIEKRKEVDDFVGDFLRISEMYCYEATRNQCLQNILSHRPEWRIIAREIEKMTKDDVLDIFRKAEIYGLDHLLSEED